MLGVTLRQALAERDFSVLRVVRSAPVVADQLQWDYSDANGFLQFEGLEGLTAAIHLSGANLAAHRWTPEYRKVIAESRINSTRALATALAGLKLPPKMLLVASAAGIYGNRGEELIDETSPLGTGFLADTCRQWEAAAQPAIDVGIRVLHLRLGVILGAGPGGALASLVPLFRFGLGAQLGNGGQYMSWISMADVLGAIFFLLESTSLAGPLNFTAPNPVTNAQFTRALAAHLHRPAFLTIPAFALRLALGEIADEVLLSGARVYPARLAAAGFQFTHPSLVHAFPAILP